MAYKPNPKNLEYSLTAKVNEDTYRAVVAMAGNKKPGAWLRELVEARLALDGSAPDRHLTRVMEELLALRFVLFNALPTLAQTTDPQTMVKTITGLIEEANQRKAASASAALTRGSM